MSNGRTPAGDAAFVEKLRDRLKRAPELAVVLITITGGRTGGVGVSVVEYGTVKTDLEYATIGLRDHIANA